MERLPDRVENDGLVLCHWRPEDAPALDAAVRESLDHLRPWMPWIRFEPMRVSDRRLLLERWDREWEEGGDSVFAVWQDGVVVGGAGLKRRLGPGALEIGYWVHVGAVGRGLATASARALTDLAFTVPGIDRVEIHHDVTNAASARVPTKLAYELVGEVDADREVLAPAETGRDLVWRMARPAWLGT